MSTIKDLLHEVTDAVEPGDRLDAIRAATAQGGRRTHRGWWAAGGIGLVAASVVTALALSTGGAQQVRNPDPANEPTATPTAPSPTTTSDDETADAGVRALYFIGDTPAGPRLYREFRLVDPADPLSAAVGAAVGRVSGKRPYGPDDPDYRVVWPALTTASAMLSPTGDVIEITLSGDPDSDLLSRGDLPEDEARLAIEALVRTAQAAVGERLPVQFRLSGGPVDTLLGVPTAEPVTTSPDLDVLSHVNLSDPFEGQVVDNDEPLRVTGVGASADDRVSLRIRQWDGPAVLYEIDVDLEPSDAPLAPFSVRWSLGSRPPGDYEVVVTVTDADGAVDTDTRRITVVD